MKRFVGSALVVIGNIWVTVSTCGMMIMAGLFWLVGLVWILGSWGGILFAILWVMFGFGLVGLIVGLASLPVRLFGAGIIVLGESLKNAESFEDGMSNTDGCAECGRTRVSYDDQFCRGCGQAYG